LGVSRTVRGIIVYIAVFGLIFAVLPSYDSFADKPDDVGKSKYSISVEEITIPAQAKLPDGRIAEKVVHVFYEEGFSHKPGHDKGGGPPDKGGKGGGDKCYSVLAKGAKWKTVEDYIIDPTNTRGLLPSFVDNTIVASVTTWNDDSPSTIFGSNVTGVVDGADKVAPDGKNEVMFGEIVDPGVIAVTITWGVYGGPPQARYLVEWDAVFDDDSFDWGNADPGKMDLQNIATHEFGHAAGLGHPENTCTDETMYAFASVGEIKKRDLNTGDIAGIDNLY